MIGASRRSVSSAAARSAGSRWRCSAPAVSSPASSAPESVAEPGPQFHKLQGRHFSVLSSPRTVAPRYKNCLDLRSSFLISNHRLESTAAAVDSTGQPSEKFEYQAEVSRLMDLIVHSLYSNKEVFLRELISNASDALDKLRFLGVTQPELLKDAIDLDIRIHADKDNGIITITDSGIGMTREELVRCLGTIAESGTAKFLQAVKESQAAGTDSNLIGQFGVGFYSAFLVSDKVVVSTKSPRSDKQYVWEGEANASSYTIREETDPAKFLQRGTHLALYLKRDDKGFAHPERIQKLVKNYSQFVSFPIYTWQEKGITKEIEVDEDPSESTKEEGKESNVEKKKKTKKVVEKYWDWELTNETQPIWLRSPKEVTTEDYNEFYKKTFDEYLDPLASSHFTTEVAEPGPQFHKLQGRHFSVLSSPRTVAPRYKNCLDLRSSFLISNHRLESTAAAVDSTGQPSEKFEYQAEVSRLMDLIVHSLYSNKEVFLRELISNASDALDKLRFLGVTQPELLKDAIDLDIRIHADKDNGIITITDSGIGMTREELVRCLGTIAESGTAKFLQAVKESQAAGTDSNLIGQFGVGFYSAFLVSDKVVVSTKSPRSDKQYVWEGEANASSYTIREETDPTKFLQRGTHLALYLKRDDKGFAHPERIQKLVKNYSQFVSFPIYTWQEKGITKEIEVDEDPSESTKEEGKESNVEKKKKTKKVVEKYWDWELTNETQPIWLRSPKEVTTEDYNEFYKKTFDEYLDPLASSHFTTEGEVEFRSILYVPAVKKDEIMNSKTKNIRLYVKRVFISDDFDGELFPRYLSFVKGIVDSNDLPLNVSREILQESRIVRIMRKRLVRKAFDMILGISCSENREDYERFWDNFGKYLKLGCIEDKENHKRLAPLLRFFSSQSEEELISLDEYVENMKAEQKGIYYIASDSLTSAKNAPFLERLIQKGYEVLFLVDPIDEVAIQNLKSYKEKDFVDISKEKLDLGDKNEEKEQELMKEFGQTCDWIKKRLGDKVASVQISNRLSTSPCVLVSGQFGWSANMERLMKAQQSMTDSASLDFMRGRRVFEINPEHPIIKDLNAAYRACPGDPEAERAIDLLYDTALISSGFTPENPSDLSGKIYEMMGLALRGKWRAPPVESWDNPINNSSSNEPIEAEVVEPIEVQAEVVEPIEVQDEVVEPIKVQDEVVVPAEAGGQK